MDDCKYLVTYADKTKRTFNDLREVFFQPTDPRDEVIDCKILYDGNYDKGDQKP